MLNNNLFDSFFVIFNLNYFVPIDLNWHFFDHFNYSFRSRNFHYFSVIDRYFFYYFLNNQFFLNDNYRFFFLILKLFKFNLFDNLMSSYFFFHNKRNLLLNNNRYLHLYWFNLCFMNFHSLILNSVSVRLNRNFFDYFIRNSFFDLNLNRFLLIHFDIYNFLNLNVLNLFFTDNNWLFDKNLYRNFNVLNDDLRNRNLDNLKFFFSNYYNFLYNFRYFYDPIDDSRNNYDFLDNFFNLDDSRDFHNLFHNNLNNLRLNSYDFFLNYHRHRFLHKDLLGDFLTSCYDFSSFDLDFLYFFSNIGHCDLTDHWYLLFDVERYYFFNLDIASDHYFLNNRLVNKYFDLSDQFFFVSLNEM